MTWFRLYNDVWRNPKVQAMRPELFKFWINLLCIASEQEDRGRIPTEASLKLQCRLREDVLKRYCGDLVALKLLVRDATGTFKIANWEERQPESDDAAKRAKAYRDKGSGKNKAPNEPVEPPLASSQCHVTDDVTHHGTYNTCVTGRARSDSDSDSELIDGVPPKPPGGPVGEIGGGGGEEPRNDSDPKEIGDQEDGPGGSVAIAALPAPAPTDPRSAFIAAVEAAHGPAVAVAVAARSIEIGDRLGGRFDLFLAQIPRALAQVDPPVAHLVPWCLVAVENEIKRQRALNAAAGPPAANGAAHRSPSPQASRNAEFLERIRRNQREAQARCEREDQDQQENTDAPG